LLAAQDKSLRKEPVKAVRADQGKAMFESYCSACHGLDGKGDGPARSALKGTPADLTLLAQKNGGKFPANHVAVKLREVDQAVHGSKEMPIWGPLLSSVSGNSEAEVQLRISNLTRYIQSLQVN
jgi:mono/diheme cytochrome c family protein